MHEVWYVVWTDNFDGVGTDLPIMEEIMKACHSEWAVKQTSNEYMVGVQRKFQINPDGTQHAIMLMPAYYVDGIVALCHVHLIKAGWTNGVTPTVPFPKEQLTLHDPNGEVTDRKANTVLERGFNTVKLKGLTMWAGRCCFPECRYGNCQLSKVASRPTELAWTHMMNLVAWMRHHRNRGIRINSTGNHIPVAYIDIDASNKQDPKSGLCQYGFDMRMAGGPLVSHSSLLKNVGFVAPSQEAMGLGECVGHMSLLWTLASVLWLRRLLTEIGLSDWVCTATVIFSDSVTAIDWAKFGKITPGNSYLAL